jgi:hypothetical protein
MLFPNQWHQVLLAPAHLRLGEDVTFRDDEIHKAFAELMKRQETYKTHCFCFFVDGLDEYEETPQADYKVMVEFLQKWTQVSLNNVKLCISSREYNVFLNNFSAEKRIKLQDLTWMDMERYVSGMLSDLEASEEKKDLVRAVLYRSDGIFLWVALVVKDLRERLEDGCSIPELRQELASLPQELEALFRRLLDSIRPSSRTTAYLVFSMVHRLGTYNFKLRLHACSFLDDYQRDPLFAFQAELAGVNLDATHLSTQNSATRKKINGHCRGLVDIVKIDDLGPSDLYLAFTHRSISEFFQEPSFQHEMETQLTGVIIEDVVCQILLADIRCRDLSCLGDEFLGQYVFVIVSMRARLNLDLPPYRYLYHLNSAVAGKTRPDVEYLVSQETDIATVTTSTGVRFGVGHSLSPLTSPFYVSACQGNLNFVACMMNNKLTMEDRFLIGCLSCRIRRREVLQDALLLNMMESLVDEYKLSGATSNDSTMAFAWTSFVVSAIGLIPESCLHLPAVPLFGKLIVSFLRAGADPRVSFILESSGSLPGTMIRLGSPTKYLRFTLILGTSEPSKDHQSFCDSRFRLLFDENNCLSFRDMVKYWNLSNEKEILDLIDERTKWYENELDDEQNTESPQRLALDAPQDREITGLDVAKLVEVKAPHESPEAEATVAAWTLGTKPQAWYSLHGFGYAGIILIGTYPVLLFLLIFFVSLTLAICNRHCTAS